jgi:two-component system phosphate regulon sensor histidine kinase PhoR
MKAKPIILAVDDQPQNIELLEAYLIPQGYEIVKAASGIEALEKISSKEIDLVLLDIMMPKMSGFEVLEKLRADEKTRLIPVVMVTALTETEDRVKAIEAGCDDFISKPFDRHELLARVKSLLRIKSLNDEIVLANERNFRNVFDNAADGILLAEVGSKKFYLGNPAICRMLGYTPEEIKNLGVMDIYSKKDLPDVMDPFERQANGDISMARDLSVKRKDGSVFYADINSSTVKIAGKTYMMGFFHDNTERKKAEEIRINFERMKLKEESLSSISHELKTPITSMLIFSNLAEKEKLGKLNKKQKAALGYITKDTLRLQQIVERILLMSRVDLGLELNLQTAEFEDILNKSLQLFVPSAIEKKIKLNKKIASNLPNVLCDKERIGDVLNNLIGNAIKFTGEGGSITVEVKQNGKEIQVKISDTGLGIPEKDLPKLFSKFYQSEETKKHVSGGTGLGLYICKSIIEKHKGRIWVESTEGKGSSFYFTIPIAITK